MFENDYTINGKHATYLKFLAKKMLGTIKARTIPQQQGYLNATLMFI